MSQKAAAGSEPNRMDPGLPGSSQPRQDHITLRPYAAFQYSSRGLIIEDSDSVTGTWVNGNRIRERCLLSEGDRVRTGETDFIISAGRIVVLTAVADNRHTTRGSTTDRLSLAVVLPSTLLVLLLVVILGQGHSMGSTSLAPEEVAKATDTASMPTHPPATSTHQIPVQQMTWTPKSRETERIEFWQDGPPLSVDTLCTSIAWEAAGFNHVFVWLEGTDRGPAQPASGNEGNLCGIRSGDKALFILAAVRSDGSEEDRELEVRNEGDE